LPQILLRVLQAPAKERMQRKTRRRNGNSTNNTFLFNNRTPAHHHRGELNVELILANPQLFQDYQLLVDRRDRIKSKVNSLRNTCERKITVLKTNSKTKEYLHCRLSNKGTKPVEAQTFKAAQGLHSCLNSLEAEAIAIPMRQFNAKGLHCLCILQEQSFLTILVFRPCEDEEDWHHTHAWHPPFVQSQGHWSDASQAKILLTKAEGEVHDKAGNVH
jgi:pyruvate carboxylase